MTVQIKDCKQHIKLLEIQRTKLQNTLELESKEENLVRAEVDKLRAKLNSLPEKLRFHKDALEKLNKENRSLKTGTFFW